MLTSFIRLRETAYRLCNNERGVVSFEYVIVAACVVAAVAAVFGATGTTGIQGLLTRGFNAITTAFTTAGIA